MGSGNNNMSLSAQLDTGCGTYSYTLSQPLPPLITSGNGYALLNSLTINSYGTTGTNGLPIDPWTMQACLLKQWDGRWHSTNSGGPLKCGNLRWETGGYILWKSAYGCVEACINLLSGAINKGANNARCFTRKKDARCWVSFYP